MRAGQPSASVIGERYGYLCATTVWDWETTCTPCTADLILEKLMWCPRHDLLGIRTKYVAGSIHGAANGAHGGVMLTSLNRVYLGRLYPTDILASCCIGAN